MLQALHDPFAQFVVVTLLTLASLIVAIIGLRAYRSRKRLSYKVILHERLLGVQEDTEGRVQITFDSEPVHDVQLLILHLLNTGNVAIQETDYVHPLGFNFGSEARLLSVEVTRRRPATMTYTLEVNANRFTLRPDVLNGGDGLEIKALLTGRAAIQPEGRIKDVSEIKRIPNRIENTLWFFSIVSVPPILLIIA